MLGPRHAARSRHEAPLLWASLKFEARMLPAGRTVPGLHASNSKLVSDSLLTAELWDTRLCGRGKKGMVSCVQIQGHSGVLQGQSDPGILWGYPGVGYES